MTLQERFEKFISINDKISSLEKELEKLKSQDFSHIRNSKISVSQAQEALDNLSRRTEILTEIESLKKEHTSLHKSIEDDIKILRAGSVYINVNNVEYSVYYDQVLNWPKV